jgi:putative acyl-CoA dehydrogenase
VITKGVEFGCHKPWKEPRPGAHVAQAAVFMLFAQVEPGHSCPISMTYSVLNAP